MKFLCVSKHKIVNYKMNLPRILISLFPIFAISKIALSENENKDEATQFLRTNVAEILGPFEDHHRPAWYARGVLENEDCLYLNVFAPAVLEDNNDEANPQQFPVMVFIHPGGFQIGSSSDFKKEAIIDNFVKRGVIFLTFNYRLGPFGFITTNSEQYPGNLGLWDIVEVLKWVQVHISSFHGDPNRVTLIGQGSGGTAASLLSVSPVASDLFSNIILMSGTGMMPGMVRDTASSATWALNVQLMCRAKNETGLMSCLKHQLADDIVAAVEFGSNHSLYHKFMPRVDGVLLPNEPELLLAEGLKKPTMLGTTKDEAEITLAMLQRYGIDVSKVDSSVVASSIVYLTESTNKFMDPAVLITSCLYEYVNSRLDPNLEEDQVTARALQELYSDYWYSAPAAQLASWHTEEGQPPAYLYSFDHISENLFIAVDGGDKWRGAFHGLDLVLLLEADFKFLGKESVQDWNTDRRVIDIFSELITNFAHRGSPTSEENGLSFHWVPVTDNKLNFLSIGDHTQMKLGYHWRGHTFWNDFMPKLNQLASRITSNGDSDNAEQCSMWKCIFG